MLRETVFRRVYRVSATMKDSAWATKLCSKAQAKRLDDGCLDRSKFKEFKTYIDSTKARVNELVTTARSKGQEIAGYGAARSGPTLAIQLGLENSLSYLVDDHPSKVGKYAAFENLEVLSGSQFIQKMPSITFILAWLHYKNIIGRNVEYLKNGGKFALLWPEITVVDYDNHRDFWDSEEPMTLKLGFIGVGFIAQQCHLPAFDHRGGACIHAVSDLHEDLAEKIGARYEVDNVYRIIEIY